MIRRLIIVDEQTRPKLERADEATTLCAADGTVLGFFTPAPPQPKLNLQPQISEEEMARRMADRSQGYTTEEVIQYLKSLRRPE